MAIRNPIPGEIYRNFMGKTYEVVTLAKDVDTLKAKVVYKSTEEDDMAYVQDFDAFIAGFTIEEKADPWLVQFLDAKTLDDKYEILLSMRPAITDRLIDDIAMIMDVVIEEGPIDKRYSELKACIAMRKRFEISR